VQSYILVLWSCEVGLLGLGYLVLLIGVFTYPQSGGAGINYKKEVLSLMRIISPLLQVSHCSSFEPADQDSSDEQVPLSFRMAFMK